MQHLPRRFSGYVFLYVTIASLVWIVLFNLALWGISFDFNQQNPTLIRLIFRLIIFVPPFVAVALSKYPVRDALRIHAFPLTHLWFAIGMAICAYLSLSMLQKLLNQTQLMLLHPEFGPVQMFSVHQITWPYLITGCLIPVLLEGTTYNGAIFSGLRQMRPLKACLTVGLLYALIQYSLSSFIPNALLGFILCYITLRANSIIPGIITAFLYEIMTHFTVADRLYFSMLSPAGIGDSTAAVIVAVAFILLGGLLLIKMPSKKYVPGSAKRTLGGLRRTFPGLFSVSGLDIVPEDTEALNEIPAEAAVSEATPDATKEATSDKPSVDNEALTADISNTEFDIRENNPMIVGIFISATITVILFGFSILMSLGYFVD